MVKKDPRQDLYDTIWQTVSPYARVYDFIPPKDTPYPFIRLGEYQGDDQAQNKTAVFGTYFQMVHFWWTKEARQDMTGTMGRIKQALREIDKTPGGFQIGTMQISEQVIPDVDGTISLLHGVLVITAIFN